MDTQPLTSTFSKPVDGEAVCAALGALRQGAALPNAFTGVSTDSRAVSPGQVFIAIRGDRHDGHTYLAEAQQAGAAAAVVDEVGLRQAAGSNGSRAAENSLPLLVVPDTLQALGDLAAWRRRQLPIRVVAVTGSNGKTTAKEFIAGVLAQRYNVGKTLGNFNNLIGVPLTLLRLHPQQHVAVIEMGMNHPGEIARLAHMAQPEVGVLTNVGPAHLEFFGNLDDVANAKAELLDALPADGAAVLNGDDPLVRAAAQRASARVVWFGTSTDAGVRVVAVKDAGLDGVRVRFLYADGSLQAVHLRCLGVHNVEHAAAAAAVGVELGLDAGSITAGLEAFAGLPMHLEPIRLRNGAIVLNDAYNANPASTAAAVRFLATLPRRGRAILVAGEMLEMGEHAEELHREVGRLCAQLRLDMVIGVEEGGRHAAALVDEARCHGAPAKACAVFATVAKAAAYLTNDLRDGDVVLCKASRGVRLERLCEALIAEVGSEGSEKRPLMTGEQK